VIIRIDDRLINTDAIAHVRFDPASFVGLGIPGSGGATRPSLTIYFMGGSEIVFGNDGAEQIWKLLCTKVSRTIGAQEPPVA
jgi:hypothetical protein